MKKTVLFENGSTTGYHPLDSIRDHVRRSSESETPMHEVKRWGDFMDLPNAREQSTLEHAFSFSVFAGIAIHMLRDNDLEFDEYMLLQTCVHHDRGEGLLGRDVSFGSKRDEHDAAEYRAFKETHKDLSRNIQNKLERIFLLQFATKDSFEAFPRHGQVILRWLKRRHYLEATLFSALECFDYLMWPFTQWIENNEVRPLIRVLRDQTPRLDSFVTKVPKLNVLWSYELKHWCEQLLHAYRHLPYDHREECK